MVDRTTVESRRLEAERALDAVLADSFPASDPPSWTLGVTGSHSAAREKDGINLDQAGAARPGEK
jgi:hypothetical protein